MHIKSNEPQYGIGYSEGMGWPDESGRGSGNSVGRGACKSGYTDAGEDYATGNANGAGYIGRHNQGTGSGTGVCQGYGLNYEYKEK